MITKRVLLQGDCDLDQLHKIIRFKGRPNPEEWPEISKSKVDLSYFREYQPISISDALVGFDLHPDALDLLERMLELNPNKRISSHEAVKHV